MGVKFWDLPGFSGFFFLCVCLSALTRWEVLSEHLQLVFHSAAQHLSQINQSDPPLLTVSANGGIKGGIKSEEMVPFWIFFSSHLSSSPPVTDSLSSSSSPPPLLKQNICHGFKMLWAFSGCYQQGQDLAGRGAERSHSR